MSELLVTIVSAIIVVVFLPIYLCWVVFICTKAFYIARHAAEQWNQSERTKTIRNRIKETYQDGDRQTEA